MIGDLFDRAMELLLPVMVVLLTFALAYGLISMAMGRDQRACAAFYSRAKSPMDSVAISLQSGCALPRPAEAP